MNIEEQNEENCELLTAIEAVSGLWGVSADNKLSAIRVILARKVDASKVVSNMEQIQNSLGNLESMRDHSGFLD